MSTKRQRVDAAALRNVLRLISDGRTNEQIGRKLGISEEAAKWRVRLLCQALRARDRAHAVRRGFELGLLVSGDEPSTAAEERSLVDWQVLERARIAEARGPRPISVRHIGSCFAAEACPCRTGSTWKWPDGQQFADPVPMPEEKQ